MYNCKYFINCKKCTGKCKIFQSISCKDRDRNIGVCNNCENLKSCKLDKYFGSIILVGVDKTPTIFMQKNSAFILNT